MLKIQKIWTKTNNVRKVSVNLEKDQKFWKILENLKNVAKVKKFLNVEKNFPKV